MIIAKRNTPLSFDINIERTNPALDDGNFLMTSEDKKVLLAEFPLAEKFILPVIGAAEFLRGINKY